MLQKVLLVEDEEFIRDLYKRQLEKDDFVVDAFVSGVPALESLEKNAYDLIVLDIMLPQMSGLEILKKIKANEQTKKIPVILLTNLGYEGIIKEGFSLGADGYLIKSSYSPNQIVTEIKEILQKSKNKTVGLTTEETN